MFFSAWRTAKGLNGVQINILRQPTGQWKIMKHHETYIVKSHFWRGEIYNVCIVYCYNSCQIPLGVDIPNLSWEVEQTIFSVWCKTGDFQLPYWIIRDWFHSRKPRQGHLSQEFLPQTLQRHGTVGMPSGAGNAWECVQGQVRICDINLATRMDCVEQSTYICT